MVNSVKLVWATPDADKLLAYIARVSNPDNQDNENVAGLLRYMMREGHVSPFEMCSICLEINTTRDIARQILRHRSFHFQEFSQRYQDVKKLGDYVLRECRLQDTKNRQNSLECHDTDIIDEFNNSQRIVGDLAYKAYTEALELGVAKEQARVLLPEGMTPSRLYMNCTLRDLIFYLKSRLHHSTQKEHRVLAQEILRVAYECAPITIEAFFNEELIALGY